MEDFVPILSHTPKEEWEDVLQAKLSWCSLKRVRDASVVVVGCGALGNEVIKNLVLFGVRKIVVVDFDRVEEYNLSRSILFSKEDAIESLPKVQAIQKKVKEINPEVEIIPIVGDVYHAVGLGLLKRVDAVIGCVDSRWARFCINRLCMRAGIKWIDGGIEGLEGTARVFAPGENCYACNLTPEMFKDIKKRVSCPSIIQRNERAERAATTPIIASIIAAVQVQEFLKIIHENKEKKNPFSTLCGNMFYYEGEHFTTKVVKLKGFDEGCPEHETWEDILTLPLSAEDKVGSVLSAIKKELKVSQAEIVLRNHTFVDYIVEKETDKNTMCCIPNYNVFSFVGEYEVSKGRLYSNFYQHEFSVVREDFPYKELSLKQLGFPYWDILQIDTPERGTCYVELSKDANLYPSFN